MNYKLLSETTPRKETSTLLLILVPTTITLMLLMIGVRLELNIVLVMLVCVGFPLLDSSFGISRRLFKDWTTDKDIIGNVQFNASNLEIDTKGQIETLDYQQVKAINLNHNYIRGKRYTAKDILHNGVCSIELEQQNNSKRALKILIENREQFQALEAILSTFYKQGSKVKETIFNDQKTILLKLGRPYDDLQKLKRELGLTSFY